MPLHSVPRAELRDRARQGDVRAAFDLIERCRIKTLKGLIPICATCKKVRNDEGIWLAIDTYIAEHSDADFTHGICPDCMTAYFENEAMEQLKSN